MLFYTETKRMEEVSLAMCSIVNIDFITIIMIIIICSNPITIHDLYDISINPRRHLG